MLELFQYFTRTQAREDQTVPLFFSCIQNQKYASRIITHPLQAQGDIQFLEIRG